ncbi:FIG000988: Predicted permease [hydrothermal vent metagenome]|uniref:Lipopolysaccharide export system permease protein LptF n=1 Tax=hydrothermal vent metagenome TaxID=652676 RepID=A0A1W1BPC2_9ZZZZ
MKFVKINKLNNTFYQIPVLMRYFSVQILWVFLAIILVLGLVLIGDQLLNLLRKAHDLGISQNDLIPLVLLKSIVLVKDLLPLAIFLAVIVVIGRLYKDSEIVVLNASGINELQMIKLLQPLMIFIFLLVMWLSFFITPWSHLKIDQTLNSIDKSKQLSLVKANKFQEFSHNKIMFYASEVSEDHLNMKGIFSQLNIDNTNVIIVAKTAKQWEDEKTKDVYLSLQNGQRFQGFDNKGDNSIIDFNSYNIRIFKNEKKEIKTTVAPDNYDAKNISELWKSNNIRDKIELNLRLSNPLSVILLMALGVLLAKSSPREGNSKGIFIGVLVFILYNNSLIFVEERLIDGKTSFILEIWLVYLLLLLSIYLIYDFRHYLMVSRFIKKIRKKYVKQAQ